MTRFHAALACSALALLPLRAPADAQAPRAAARPAPEARRERPVPYRPGETLTFDVSYSQFLTAGTATVTVREKRPSFDSVAYYIVAEGRPTPLVARLYNVYYKADTLLDAFTLLPQRGSMYSEEGARKRMKATRFDQAARRGTFEMRTATVVERDLRLPPFTQDPLSAVYVLRAMPLREGATLTMPVTDSGRLYRMRVLVTSRETVATPLGSLAAWKIVPTILEPDGKPSGQTMAIWISDDARRLPVRMEAQLPVGSFVIVLREVRG